MKIYPQLLTSSIKPQVWLFHVVVLLTTAKKWTKVKNARAERSKLYCFCLLIMQICDVLVAVAVVVAKAPYRRGQRQRERHNTLVFMRETTSPHVLHVRYIFWYISLPSSAKQQGVLRNDDGYDYDNATKQ